jgi:DNA-binding NtrC family response regulator
MSANILIIDDDPGMCRFLRHALERDDHKAAVVSNGEDGVRSALSDQYDVILLDVNLPDGDGLDFLHEIRKTLPRQLIVVITACGEVSHAVKALHAGAFDYLAKPFEYDDLQRILVRALDVLRLRGEIDLLQRDHLPHRLVEPRSPQMRAVLQEAERIAASPSTTVLICGETGVGKEIVARLIHEHSPRSAGPFVAINCAAFGEHLLESEVFGHEKGAFTDAAFMKRGLIEVAQGGSMFLDEVSELDLKLQAKLLRVLEERTFRRVGGTKDLESDVRIISATNRRLEAMVEEGNFRQDLFFRLQVVPIDIPPLRSRREDIQPLVEGFLARYDVEFSKQIEGFTPEAMQALVTYDWPGNIREMKNLLERLVLLEKSTLLDVSNLPRHIMGSGTRTQQKRSPQVVQDESFREAKARAVADFEKTYLIQLLRELSGNVSQAARRADMDRASLQRLLRRHKINAEDFRQ